MIVRVLCIWMLFTPLARLQAQTIQVSKDNKTIVITATDSAESDADTAEVSIGFTAYGMDQEQTYADASKTSNQIVNALITSGLKREQIRSSQQSLTSLDNDEKIRFAKGLRFIFSQTWKVTARASQAAEVLHVAVTSGANNSGGIEWKLADDNALEAEAAQKALSHAEQIAKRMAAGLNTRLGPLIYASNQLPQRNFFGAQLNTENASLSSTKINLKPLAIVPDKIIRSATVYAIFSIE